jgi:serine/threonine protein phosphatase PrpC
VATKKAFQNEKTEIFALDYDAISNILKDALAENEDEFKIDAQMSKKLSQVIADEGYGEHNVMVFGKRKLKILARGLDLSDKSSDVTQLRKKLEGACRVRLSEPTFELAFGSVNMQLEAKRTYSADAAFSTYTSDGESICGDTVSIFENKNDYLYCLISDGMGTGRNAAITSETCSAFLQNMLNAGNRMETSLRMLNSVLRVRGARSEDECSSTIDLLQFDLYSGALTMVKSGAAPTFVVRRGNVFKLASPSFPIGILRALDAKQIDISCEDGDIIVMVSDGATFGVDESEYLCDMLREDSICDKPPREIAEQIIRRARAEKSYNNDDVSVAVIKIKKEICNW